MDPASAFGRLAAIHADTCLETAVNSPRPSGVDVNGGSDIECHVRQVRGQSCKRTLNSPISGFEARDEAFNDHLPGGLEKHSVALRRTFPRRQPVCQPAECVPDFPEGGHDPSNKAHDEVPPGVPEQVPKVAERPKDIPRDPGDELEDVNKLLPRRMGKSSEPFGGPPPKLAEPREQSKDSSWNSLDEIKDSVPSVGNDTSDPIPKTVPPPG